MADIAAIPGITQLWGQTHGDPRVLVAILDGPADFTHPCFRGADVTQAPNTWRYGFQTPSEFVTHATHISSVIFGQHDSAVRGIAPGCRGINIPVAVDEDSLQNPLDLTRGIDAAREAGANIIHVACCHSSPTGLGDGFVERAIRNCVDNNILVVAPAGNDGGRCMCLPAALPHVLSVGALSDAGIPLKLSNWGGSYQSQGIVAPGENILGAEPGDVTRRRKGTSCAAPIVSGVGALLMSLQLQGSGKIDADAVRSAILESALACQSDDMDEPGRCLVGKLNISGAQRLLFDSRYNRDRLTRPTPASRRRQSA